MPDVTARSLPGTPLAVGAPRRSPKIEKAIDMKIRELFANWGGSEMCTWRCQGSKQWVVGSSPFKAKDLKMHLKPYNGMPMLKIPASDVIRLPQH